MIEVRFKFPKGKIASLEMPETKSDKPSVFLVGIKKGGSTLLAKVMRDLAPFCERPLFEYSKIVFERGLPGSLAVDDMDRAFQKRGYVFGVFRWLPENDLLHLNPKVRKDDKKQMARDPNFVLMIRDPRDALVSLYYSDAKSHPLPKEGELRKKFLEKREQLKHEDIDRYVLRQAPHFLRHFYRTLQITTLSNATIIRYEDIIYDKPALVRAVAEAMEADVNDKKIAEIARKHDIIPTAETEQAHIRQVHPKNYKAKLQGETIERLNEEFRVVLDSFGYER